MKNASSAEKLTSGTTSNDIASRVKNLFSGSPVNKRKRTSSLNSLSTNTTPAPPPPPLMLGVPLQELVARDGHSVPFLVRKVVQHVEKHGLDQVGLYRINGNVKVIDRLRTAFDKVGDVDFDDEDIASVAGLLKLFLRELPDGVIPEILMPHFVSLQQSYPSEVTPEALDALQHTMGFLPDVNRSTLKYIIRHLARVAEHSESNKMTPVSLSIVFGPNLFHCGSGLEALRLQGYSNSIVCRMIQYHKVLFAKKPEPARPLPYSEHMRKKGLSPERNEEEPPPDLDTTHSSERSIDEAIQERSFGGMSPSHLPQLPDDDHKKPPPPRPKSLIVTESSTLPIAAPPPHAGWSSSTPSMQLLDPPTVTTSTTTTTTTATSDDSDLEGSGFQRRNAMRPRTLSAPSSYKESLTRTAVSDPIMRHRLKPPGTKDEDSPSCRTPSPYSHGSPGTSPPTSPALTPRGSSVVNAAIAGTIKEYLFKPPENLSKKQNVYGFLLPEAVAKEEKKEAKSELNSSSDPLITASTEGVVRRRNKSSRSQRNRVSALHEVDLPMELLPPQLNASGIKAINDSNVKLFSISPEHKHSSTADEGGIMESMTGKVSDLVKQFDEKEVGPQAQQSGGGASFGIDGEGGDSSAQQLSAGGGGRGEGRRGSSKKISALKVFEMFENSSIMIGMGNTEKLKQNPPRTTMTPAITSSATTTTTTTTAVSSGHTAATTTSINISSAINSDAERRRGNMAATQQPSISEDEEVFASPGHNYSHPPAHTTGRHSIPYYSDYPSSSPPAPQRDRLTTTSTPDDVFLPTSTGLVAISEESQSSVGTASSEFNQIESHKRLQHLTLSRPKGPQRRKPAKRQVAPHTPRSQETTDYHHSNSQDGQWEIKQLSTEGRETSGSSSQPSYEDVPSVVRRVKRVSQREKETAGRNSVTAIETPSGPGSPKGIATNKGVAKGPNKENDVLDLTVLAPESKQAVKKGWVPENGKDSSATAKELLHKIHELKTFVREFEASFVDQHGRKPSSHEKSPIRNKLIELTRLKKQFKDLKENGSDARLSQTAPPELRTTRQMIKISKEFINSETLSAKKKSPTLNKKEGGVVGEVTTPTLPLNVVLRDIMSSLERNRKQCGRPQELELMDPDQLQEEKHAIQKALLGFEKHYGRPQSCDDKDTMRPLYDRYRAIKRVCGSSTSSRRSREDSRSSLLSMMTPHSSMTSTAENIAPSASFLFLQQSPLIEDPSPVLSQSLGGGGGMSQSRSRSFDSMRRKYSGSENNSRKSSAPEHCMLSEEDLISTSMTSLLEQSSLLLARKSELRKVLRAFETEFSGRHGRSITREDKKPMEEEYSQYKNVKTRLKTLEALIARRNPQKTI